MLDPRCRAIALKIRVNCAEKPTMAVYFCMAFVFLIALGAAVIAYAIFTAEDGCEDEQGFRRTDLPQHLSGIPTETPVKKSAFRLFNPEIPLPLFF